GADGKFTVIGLATGFYRALFIDCASHKFLPQFRDGTAAGTLLFAAAIPIHVGAPNATSGVNARMTMGGIISGRIIGPDNAAVPCVSVSVGPAGQYYYYSSGYVTTDQNGNYTVTGLFPGSYIVAFYGHPSSYYPCPSPAPTFLDQWFNNADSYGAATPIALAAGEQKAANAKMKPGTTISGHVYR